MGLWADGYVRANGIQIHYYRTGGDKPPIVLNHGAIVSTEAAAKLAGSIPGLQVADIEGAGHDVRRAKFDEYMRAIHSFLDEVYA